MRREIVLDTETTGVDPGSGHRIVEIGCIELQDGIRTGKFFQTYLNPERDMPEEAFRVHGLATEFLKEKPLFAEIVDDLLAFMAETPLVIHNAAFDIRFLNAELERCGFPPVPLARATDTVMMARRKFPGSPANLDALCKRFAIDASARTNHGALLDAELLSEVYIELLGGRQVALALETAANTGAQILSGGEAKQALAARAFPPTEDEMALHAKMLLKLKKALWANA